MPLHPVPERIAEVPPDAGFRAELRGMSLYDLVQLECNRSVARRALCVLSGNRTGHVYFDGGQVVHAVTDRAAGERALFEILGWSAGILKEVERPWPESTTIRASWQSLLMRAAHQEDESRRAGVTDSSHRIRLPPAAELVVEVGVPLEEESERRGAEDVGSNVRAVVRLGNRGEVAEKHGEVEELASTAAFVTRLVDLVGESLGLEGFVALDAALASSRLVVVRERDTVLAIAGERAATAEELRKEVTR